MCLVCDLDLVKGQKRKVMFEMTWRSVPDMAETPYRMSGRDGRWEGCMRYQIQVACSMDMRPLQTQAGLQLELRVRHPIRVGRWDLAVRVLEHGDLVV